jgi:hypothetical protein
LSFKVAVVKDKKIFVLVILSLDGVCDTGRKVPYVPGLQSVNLVLAIFINGRQE